MQQRLLRARRTPVEWAVRIGLALMIVWAGYVSTTRAAALWLRGNAPAEAHQLSPHDGRITAILSQQLSGPEASDFERQNADNLARLALRQDPTAVVAAATLGINAQIRGNTAEARRIFAYAETLSRRDLRSRLWAIEDAVARGDVPNALYNYDLALRTSRLAPDLLFPVLASVIDKGDIRAELIRRMASKPSWNDLFISYIAGNGESPQAVAQLFHGISLHGIIVSEGAQSAVMKRLIASGQLETAWGYYASIHPGADRSRSRDPRFDSGLVDPSPFDWVPINDEGIAATIQSGDRGGVLNISAPPSVGGVVVQQLQMLPVGNYILQGTSSGIDQIAGARPYWKLSCTDGRVLGRVEVPNSASRNGRFRGRLTVSADCPAQYLSLVLRPTNDTAGMSGQIDWVSLQLENQR